jgi:ABC-2 type transport system ATP-binding protein
MNRWRIWTRWPGAKFLTSMSATGDEDGVAVPFSSQMIAELERICDYLIVLLAGHRSERGRRDDELGSHNAL